MLLMLLGVKHLAFLSRFYVSNDFKDFIFGVLI